MLTPTLCEFERLSGTGNLIPVYREFLADMETPVSAFRKLDGPYHSFLLESVEGGEKWGRYSFIGIGPSIVFRCRGRFVEIKRLGRTIFEGQVDDPLEKLRELMGRYRAVHVEAAGDGIESSRHAASICAGSVGVLHGAKTYLLQDEHGQITETHSISAGLDYPGVGPEHSLLADGGRVSYQAVDDNAAVEAFHTLMRLEGIIPALESAHAVAAAVRIAPDIGKGGDIIVNLSGRGDKDINTIASLMEVTLR